MDSGSAGIHSKNQAEGRKIYYFCEAKVIDLNSKSVLRSSTDLPRIMVNAILGAEGPQIALP